LSTQGIPHASFRNKDVDIAAQQDPKAESLLSQRILLSSKYPYFGQGPLE